MIEKWLNLKKASLYTGIGIRGLRRAIYAGNLTCWKPTGICLLAREELDRFVEAGKVSIR